MAIPKVTVFTRGIKIENTKDNTPYMPTVPDFAGLSHNFDCCPAIPEIIVGNVTDFWTGTTVGVWPRRRGGYT